MVLQFILSFREIFITANFMQNSFSLIPFCDNKSLFCLLSVYSLVLHSKLKIFKTNIEVLRAFWRNLAENRFYIF